ncbi:MAG: hypothetical protein JW941_13625, partial [Candidatus Coatesbacteria bacterium]|nr:hypothetical protein [Candidatus Coatesbacteria bacterium]
NLRELKMLEPENVAPGEYLGAKKISKVAHILFFLAGFPAGIGIFYFIIREYSFGQAMWVVLTLPFSLVALAFSFHAIIDVIHKSWRAIQDGRTKIKPNAAVNYLFIPVFNLYWVFRAIGGFAAEYNRLIERQKIDVPPLSERLYMILSAFALTTPIAVVLLFFDSTRAIPIFWIFAGIVFISKTCNAINALPRMEDGERSASKMISSNEVEAAD